MGRVHSIETMGALDGPGLRMVVFLQGCPLRCRYCHNPDTWAAQGGEEWSAAELAARAARYKRFFGREGGVTFSGGEPLMQAEFVLECVQALHGAGIAVNCWTCDEKERAEELIAWGADYITSNILE